MKKTKALRLLCVSFLLCLSFLFSTAAFSQVEGEDIVIATSIPFNSKILSRDVNVQIHLPNGYGENDSTYPVLYDLNGIYNFTFSSGTVEVLANSSDIPGMIVVGVPPLPDGYVPAPYENRGENPANADLSIKFFKEELIPFVEKNYRTNSFRILNGHSVGGLFTMYTLFNYPDLFTAYIAGSPWFQTNDQYWLKNIDQMAQERNLDNKFLFMTVGKEEAQLTIDTYTELEKWMNKQTFNGLAWKSAWVEGDHGSMVGRNIFDGLIFIFKGWTISNTLLFNADVDTIDRQLKTSLAKWKKHGMEMSTIIPEQRLNYFGYASIRQREYDKAIKLFQYTLKLYPKSFNAHDSLAEAYATIGDNEKAIKYYKLAVELNAGDTDYAKRVLQNSKDKLKELGVKE
jgi:predicted alpha/beta superfamily hydrolase